MGIRQARFFSQEKLKTYSECTYFTEEEVNKLYKKFSALNLDRLDGKIGDAQTRISFENVQALPELKQCPFATRICQVFSSSGEGMNFEDFLDAMSVFNHRAPLSLKAAYAFRIFDFNEDSRLCGEDIEKAIRCLTGKFVECL